MRQTAFVIRNARRSATPPDGRFEYRIWPRRPHEAASLLQSTWALTDAERRSDIYLVHPTSQRDLVKLRDGRRLEIKHRDRNVGTVQHWTMPVSAEFPLAPAQSDALARALSRRNGLPASTGLSPAHLIAELDAFGSTLTARTVHKSRLIFRRRGCRAEICRVAIGGWRGVTIALEAADLPCISEAIEALQLGSLPNRSYGDALIRLTALGARHRNLPTPGQFRERSTS